MEAKEVQSFGRADRLDKAALERLALMIQRAAEIAAERPWRRITALLEPIKAVRYTAKDWTIVQTARIQPEAAVALKKLYISKSKTILAIT